MTLAAPELAPRPQGEETLYHVTVLSNLARAFDKYARTYDKRAIPESTFPDRFFLLEREELALGRAKASGLPAKTGLAGNRLLVLETRIPGEELRPNQRTGIGRWIACGWVRVHALHLLDEDGGLVPLPFEEACALSHRVACQKWKPFGEQRPRSVSILPVALACNARCPFCFSKASVSADALELGLAQDRTREVLLAGRERGAERAVITGGGEPSLLTPPALEDLVRTCASAFDKVVLISNGARWGRMDEADGLAALRRLELAGLSVLALSRHHPDEEHNARLMRLRTNTARLAERWARASAGLRLRWVCVLQRDGVATPAALEDYLDFALETGVEEVCFKELYVSTSVESVYHDGDSNEWSRRHQVPLRLVLEWAAAHDFSVGERLPWGAPLFAGTWRGRPLRLAAYTEPSLSWEGATGVCRSWNLMADGRCLASLEDKNSEVLPRELRDLP